MTDFTSQLEFVKLQISTSRDNFSFNERRFSTHITVAELKAKLELITGASSNSMKIDVFNRENKLICSLENNDAYLDAYHLEDGLRLHVTDPFSLHNDNDLTEEQLQTRYQLKDDEYSKKEGTVRAFLVRHKLGHYNEEYINKKEKTIEAEKRDVEKIAVGSRCRVTVQNAMSRLGTVLYTGSVDGLSGYWVGIKYDEPVGKNNGSYGDRVYFECPQNYGAFVKPHTVECGDFPEETYGLDDEF